VANLKEVRIRIASVKSTQQITSAMKLVAASKLRKAQTAIQMLRPYAGKLREILQNLSGTMDTMDEAVYAEEREVKKILLIVVTSNRGLCGPFNSSVLRQAKITFNETYKEYKESGNIDVFCIGKKGGEHLKKLKYPVVDINTEIFDDLTFENTTAIAESLMEQFALKKYDKIEVVYNQFKNAAVQVLTNEQFLPVTPPGTDEGSGQEQSSDFIFEPSKEEIVSELLPKTLKTQLYKILIDSFAAEHGARMTAMHQATENAKEMIKDLQLTYNKARQATITRELIEIVSGADALRG
jgi:F-type H+-transporting ATPase subunit gamma